MTKQIKSFWEKTCAVGRGFVKVFIVSVGVVEALAWLGLLLFAYASIYAVLKNYRTMSDALFFGLCVATVVISFRATYELAAYLRRVGNEYER